MKKQWNVEEYLKVTAQRAFQIDAMHTRLHKVFGKEAGDQDGDVDEDMLSPTERVKYYTLKDKMGKVKVAHIYARPETLDLHFFNLSLYCGLQELILEMVPPSTAIDLFSLRDRLVSLEIINSGIPDMAKALTTGLSRSFFKNFMPMVLQKATAPGGRRASASGPEYDQYKWSKLTLLRLRNCGLCRMDSSLHLFPAVTTVDLSHNQISNIIHLQDCHWLSDLDLSCNRISVLSNLSRVVGNLLHLNLSNNLISNLDGIEKLYALESVNLANNEIDDESEIRLLTRLPCLESIELKGNPISEESGYREFFFLQFLVDGQIQRSGREVPMLDNEPMDESELRMLRSQLFRVPDEQQKDLSRVDHDFDGNIIDRYSGEADGDSGEAAVEGGGGRGRSSTTPHRLSAFSDMSMRELSATLKGEDIAAAACEYDSMAAGSGGERRRFSLGAEKGARSMTTMSGSDLSNPKVRNLGGAHGGRNNALVSATSFSSGERGNGNGNGIGNGNDNSHWSGGSPLRGSPTRRAKTQYESIATDGAGVSEVYVRKAKAGKRLAATNRVVVEIAGDQNQSVDDVDVARMLEDATERIAHASAGHERHFMADIHSSPIKILHDAAAGQLLPLVSATVPGTATTAASTAAATNATENVNVSSPSALRAPGATMSRVESLRGTDSPQSGVHSLATTPQIYSLHETTQEREGIHRESIERLMNAATASSDSDERNLSTASVDSDTEQDFNIGSLGAPSALREKVESALEVTIQESMPIRGEANNFEINRSRLVSRDMPLDQRMRLMSGALSSEEGGGGSSRQVSVDSMGISSLNQLRASLAGGTQQDVSVLPGVETPKEQGSSLTGPTAFLASVAERAKEEKVKEMDEKKDKTAPISLSLFGTLGSRASSSTPASSGASTPAGSPVRGGNAEQERVSFGGDSGGSSPSTRSSKAIAAAASLTAKWAAKAAAASVPSSSPPRGVPSEEAAAASSNNSSPSRNSETGKVGGPSLAGLLVVDALDDFASKYVGELEYRRLRVAENLELYLKEQVFRTHGGSSSGPGHLYLAWKNTPTVSVGEGKEQYVKRSAETEVYLSCFLEVVNALGAPPQDSPKGTAVPSSSERKKMKKEKKKKKEKEGGKIDDDAVEETNNIIILTSEAVYFVAATIAPSLTFDDAPLLQVLSAHSLYSLSSCTVYFGFQRCMLEFVSCISPGEEGEAPYDFGNESVFRYMVVTREKSNTHPIITKIPKAANSARTDRTNTVSAIISDNVKIFNRDSQLLDAVADYAESKSHGKSKKHDPDIAHYQMLHQIWRKRPGVSAPRSIVITSTLLLLCTEDLHEQDVKLSVLDHSSVGDISKVIAEDDPLCVTIVFKSASFGITQRKWRVRLSSTAAASRLLQDLRKD